MTGTKRHNNNAKLTDKQVLEMGAAFATGETTCAALGRRYGIAPATVRKIVAGTTWTHLPTQARPRTIPSGDDHWTHTRPERVARGDRHWTHTHPERVARGDHSGARKHPERHARGEGHSRAKLTESAVLAIRQTHANGEMSTEQLAAHWGVTPQCILSIVHRLTWKHVP